MEVTDKKKIATYYEALLARNSNYVGIFFVGVRTTAIFCIATCRARKPKLENVAFYTTMEEALENGFRPCKICKPTENANEAPEQVVRAMALVTKNSQEKISDRHLRQLQISPEVVRRWFKKHYGITFQAYQRMYKINNAFQELKQGKNATHTAFDTSYGSLSGFGYTFKKLVGKSPKKSTDENIIMINRLTTPIGPMVIGATPDGICLLEFVDTHQTEQKYNELQQRLKAKIISGENAHIEQTKKELKAYFEGTRTTFEVPLVKLGTDFQVTVWKVLLEIEYASTMTYQDQAKEISKPKAVRAVAAANGANRIAIIIPCHRVIGRNGKMTGYSGGIERKKWLIEHEKKNSGANLKAN